MRELRKHANTIAKTYGGGANVERLDLLASDAPGGVRLRVSIVRCTPRGALTDVQEFWVLLRDVRGVVEDKVRAAAARLATR